MKAILITVIMLFSVISTSVVAETKEERCKYWADQALQFAMIRDSGTSYVKVANYLSGKYSGAALKKHMDMLTIVYSNRGVRPMEAERQIYVGCING